MSFATASKNLPAPKSSLGWSIAARIENSILNFIFYSSGIKLIILDEADSMSNDAQFSLRRVIEKYTRNARFCLICNYVSKIIPALQSRCTRFRFAPLRREQVQDRIRHIAELEK